MNAYLAPLFVLLASAPLAQHSDRLQSIKLNGPLSGDLDFFQLSPDGRWVVYADGEAFFGVPLADPDSRSQLTPTQPGTPVFGSVGFLQGTGDVLLSVHSGTVTRLYRAPLDGSQAAIELYQHDCACATGRFGGFRLAPDGTTLVFTSSFVGQSFSGGDLYSMPLDGSLAPIELTPFGGGPLAFTADGQSLIYVDNYEVLPGLVGAQYGTVAVDGSSPATTLDPPVGPPGTAYYGGSGALASDRSTLLAPAVNLEFPYDNLLYTVPVDGSAAATTLVAPGGAFEVAPDDDFAAYVSADSGVDTLLYYGRVDGTGTPTLLATYPDAVDILWLVFAPDGSRLVFTADADVNGRFELYSVPVDASQAPIQISGTLVPGGSVHPSDGIPQVTADSRTVVFRADARVDETEEIWAAPIDGSGPVRLLHNPIQLGSAYDMGEDFVLLSNSKEILFRGWPNTTELPLWLARIDQVGPFHRRSGPFVDPTRVQTVWEGFQVTAGETHAVFLSTQEDPDVAELYAFPLRREVQRDARGGVAGVGR